MKTLLICLAALVCLVHAQEMHGMPKPAKEHAWLQKLVGDWETDMECPTEPGKPPMKVKTTESARLIGSFWVVSEGSGEMMGAPFSSVLTLGYDGEKKNYVGTWIDSMTGYLWKYEGTMDEAGTKLTLDTEGPCPMQGGKICKFKESLEFKDNDHRVFTSRIQGDDGEWKVLMTMTSTRKK